MSPKLFFRLVAWILIATALAKFVSAFGSAKILFVREPLTGISYRYLLVIVAWVECLIARYLLLSDDIYRKYLLVATVTTVFMLYHLSIVYFDGFYLCPCLGTATYWLPISPRTIAWIIRSLLLFMMAGAYRGLWKLHTAENSPREADAVVTAAGN